MVDSLKGGAVTFLVLLVITGLGIVGLSDNPETFGIVGTIIWLGTVLQPHKRMSGDQ